MTDKPITHKRKPMQGKDRPKGAQPGTDARDKIARRKASERANPVGDESALESFGEAVSAPVIDAADPDQGEKPA